MEIYGREAQRRLAVTDVAVINEKADGAVRLLRLVMAKREADQQRVNEEGQRHLEEVTRSLRSIQSRLA